MSRDVMVQWYRGGADSGHLQSPDLIPMQLDVINQTEQAYDGGKQPYFLYQGYVNTLNYAFQYQDLLIDTVNIDPKTSTFMRYRIAGEPEDFPDCHYELLLDRKVGN